MHLVSRCCLHYLYLRWLQLVVDKPGIVGYISVNAQPVWLLSGLLATAVKNGPGPPRDHHLKAARGSNEVLYQ